MRELGLVSARAGLEETFADIRALSRECRFKDCSHTSEIGCAVLKAVALGELDEERFRSHMKLMKESAFNQLTRIERRRKDKQFGRMIKTVKKQLRRRKPS
jgi:ribosome biogenesis GTPase / thiamine phosphate phosphatase